MNSPFFTFLACTILASPLVAAQSPVGINVDIERSGPANVPPPTYGAASFQAGVWNRMQVQLGPFSSGPLVDVHGNPSPVTIDVLSSEHRIQLFWTPCGLVGSDAQLMGDGLECGWGRGSNYAPAGPSNQIEIRNLPAGSYRLFTYSSGSGLVSTWVSVSLSGFLGGNANNQTDLTGDCFEGFALTGAQGEIRTHFSKNLDVQAGQTVYVHVGPWFLDYHAQIAGFQIVPDGSSQSEEYCTSPANSTGQMASLVFSGTPSTATNDLTIGVRDLPLNQFGYFIVGQNQGGGVIPPGSQGNLCIGGSIGRHNRPGEVQFSGSIGAVAMPIDLLDIPQGPGPTFIRYGETWNWQYWYRDQNPQSTSNFSNAHQVSFTR